MTIYDGQAVGLDRGAGMRSGTAPRVNQVAVPSRWMYVLVLLALLPLFGQSFHYVKALTPLWALSKTFPLLSLPLALVLFRGRRPPLTRQLLISLLWLFLVPSFTAMFAFQQGFFTGLTAQVKLLPLLYFFSFLGLLRLLQPSLQELSTGFVICAGVSFALLLALWIAVPQNWYSGTYTIGSSPIFSIDGRGDRIRMPMYFGIIGIFYCARRFARDRRALWLLLALCGFAAVVGIVRTRAMVLGLSAVAVINGFRWTRPKVRAVLLALLPVALLLLWAVPYLRTIFATDASSGFDIRWRTVTEAVEFLGTNPVNWLLGVGTLSPLDPGGLITYFNHFFFLADITWLGVVFEYGLIGAFLLLLLPVRGLLLARQMGDAGKSPFLGSLEDYLLYVLAISPLYPFTLSPGEVAIIAAIFVYKLELDAQPGGLRVT